MKKNIIISSVAASILVAGLVGIQASADETNSSKNDFKKSWFERMHWKFTHDCEFRKWRAWFMKWISDEEKLQLKSMTKEERKAFFETKKAERDAEREAKKAERQAHENVIDKLLAWETLTPEEETLRTEIIKKRAERKQEMEARETQREEMKTIMEKKKAWEDLTDEEEAKLDSMKKEHKWERWHHRGWFMKGGFDR